MSCITVTCPVCGSEREVERQTLPPRRVHATCPGCGERFPFTDHLAAPPAPIPAPPVAAPVPTVPTPAPATELDFFDDDSPFDPFPEGTFEAPPKSASPPAPLSPLPPAPPSAPSETAVMDPDDFVSHRFTFTGAAGEYFGIWIVNLLLKIVTLGLYSAWAKVRQRRYFYGNTLLGDVPFDYSGDPLAIFKGWCIGAGLFIVYSLGTQLNPLLGALFGLGFFLLMPWLVVRSRMFNQRNSAHRNIRFTFQPNYREAYVVFAGLFLLVPFTLGLIMPYVIYRQKKFLAENSGYGNLRCSFLASAGDFYKLFLKVGLVTLVVVVLGGIMSALFLPSGAAADAGAAANAGPAALALVPLFMVGIFAFYFFMIVYVQTELSNLTWNATLIGDAWFISTLRTRDMAWLYLSNAVAIVCSFGLLVPWATVRTMSYRCARLEVSAPADLRAFAVDQGEIGAGGEEIGDIFGVDIGL